MPRQNIDQEISDTAAKSPYETVPISIRIRRSLYLHALQACRDGDYVSVAQYISDLIRRDKHVKSPSMDPVFHEPSSVGESLRPGDPEPRRMGFEKQTAAISGC